MRTAVRSARRSGVLSICALVALLGPLHEGRAQTPAPDRVHIHLDPAASEVHYTLKDTLHTVKGTFHLKSGDVTVNTRTGEAKGMITVDVDSGASGNDTRDGKMKRDYLETAKFPVATFEPQKVTGFNPTAASQTISIVGVFTLHGGAHPLTLEFALKLDGTHATATTHFTIPYVEWGIKDPSVPFIHVEKDVAIDIVAKGALEAAK
jgi:polyisoprenoid-binding protein YceI